MNINKTKWFLKLMKSPYFTFSMLIHQTMSFSCSHVDFMLELFLDTQEGSMNVWGSYKNLSNILISMNWFDLVFMSLV